MNLVQKNKLSLLQLDQVKPVKNSLEEFLYLVLSIKFY